MKVLAIRGRNLASLGDAFELDLEGEPLATAGVFAITGPTGSGKSTLLDAMCLALFDKTPRLQAARGHRFVDDRRPAERDLLSNDVRNILRRGAVEGFAEVDFQGVDEGRYRARWQVWRAYRKPEGRLQEQVVKLENLETGLEIGQANKTETLALIRDKLGLNFDQFCRSVVLAQGEFAAFLKADPNQRAKLLESLTGSEIYSQISQEAYERAKRERADLERMETEMGALSVLEEAARAELERTLDARKARRDELKAELEAVQRELDWHETTQRLKQAISEADAEARRSKSAWDESIEERALLKRVESAQFLRGDVDKLDELEKARRRGELEAQELDRQLKDAAAQRDKDRARLDQARAERLSAEEALTRAKPDFLEARRLDLALVDLNHRRDEVAARRDETAHALSENESKHAQTRKSCAERQRQIDEAQAWLAAHAADVALVEKWPLWERELARCAEAQSQLDALLDEQTTLAERRDQALADAAQARSELTELGEEWAELKQQANAIERAAAAFDRPALDQRRDQLEDRKEALSLCRELAARVLANEETQVSTRQQIQQDKLESERADRRWAQLEVERAEAAIRLNEAEATLKRLEAALELAQRRDELLADGQPCPLCGATEHPHHRQAAAGDAGRDDQSVRVRELKQKHGDLNEAAIRLNQAQKERTRRIAQTRQNLEDAEVEGEKHEREWRQALADLRRAGLDLEPSTSADAIDSAQETVLQETQAVRQLQNRWSEADKAAKQAREQEQRFAQTHDQRQAAAQAGEREAAKHQEAWRVAEQKVAGLRTTRDQLFESLAPIFTETHNRESLETDPESFFEACRDRNRVCQDQQTQVEASTKALDEERRGLASLEKEAAGFRKELDPLERRLSELESERGVLAGKRAELFAGAPADEAEKALTEALANAEQALDRRRGQTARAEADAERIVNQRDGAAAQNEDRRNRLDRLRRAFSEKLETEGFSEADLRDCLKRDSRWVEAHRDEIDKAKSQRDQAEAVLADRLAQLHSHETGERPEREQPDCLARRAALSDELEKAETAHAQVEGQAQQDNHNRRQRDRRAPALERQRQKTELWAEMDRLVGSAGGQKLRNFAQGLTLDRLTAIADERLQDLEPRYRLERAPGPELELRVIDAFMGDEPRSVASLSGGETFQISLAMALALSSLSSHRADIHSLFIDEGFSSLDAETLDKALSTLDALQAGGRQIGVISHLSLLAERVGVRVHVARGPGGASSVRTLCD